jgi:isopenicillin N synthase-like dioxygenase
MVGHNNSPTYLPTIDISSFCLPTLSTSIERDAVAEQLVAACEQFGMFYATLGDRVPDICAPAFAAASELFSLPETVKNAMAPKMWGASAARGYLAVGAESGGALPERKETFSYAAELSDAPNVCSNALQAENVWPPCSATANGSIVHALQAFLVDAAHVAAAVCRALSLALNDRELVTSCEAGNSVSLMRCFHYFPSDNNASETGSNQHTDWGLLTVIAAQHQVAEFESQLVTQAALQLFHDGQWRDVPHRHDAFIVNCGDFLQLRSMGRLTSPLHRVILTPQDRTSFVYFQYPAYNTPMPSKCGGQFALSILQDQSLLAVDGDCRLVADTSTGLPPAEVSFGDLIAQKWQQVGR